MDKRDWIIDVIYFILVGIFSYKLMKLNTILIEEQGVKTALELLFYNNCIVLKYFGGTLILISAAAFLVISKWQKYVLGIYLDNTLLIELILIIALCFSVGWIIYLINNPILRIILKAFVIIIGMAEYMKK